MDAAKIVALSFSRSVYNRPRNRRAVLITIAIVAIVAIVAPLWRMKPR